MTNFYSPAEIALRLNRSRRHVYRLIQCGRLPHIADGERSVRISEEQFQRFMRENECDSTKGRSTGRGGASSTTRVDDELESRRSAKTRVLPSSQLEPLSAEPTIRIVQPRTRPRIRSLPPLNTSSKKGAQK